MRKLRNSTSTISSLGVDTALTTESAAVYAKVYLSATTSLLMYGRTYVV